MVPIPFSQSRTLAPLCLAAVLVAALLLPPLALADGCFVFHWNKQIDINEPTQKAIIAYDGGREDMLLQVKFEGPLEEFGWLVPVPSEPTVEPGSMEPFYELSRLTQLQATGHGRALSDGLSGGTGGGDSLKVLQLKTVGAYEVAVLAAHDAGALARWLKVHDYSLPPGKDEIINEYIRAGWCFVAAKIRLRDKLGFRLVSGQTANAEPQQPPRALRRQLASGELHPLLISFYSPQCIFPLKVSAVAGKPSEVAVYVLSPEPLLEKSMYDRSVQTYRIAWAKWKAESDAQDAATRTRRPLEEVGLWLAQLAPWENGVRVHDWTLADVKGIVDEFEPDAWPTNPTLADAVFLGRQDLFQCFGVDSEALAACARSLPRVAGRTRWYVTKQVCRFQADEMHDLQFLPAIPLLASALANPEGDVAARSLEQLGHIGIAALFTACRSTNTLGRLTASKALRALRELVWLDPLISLLDDDLPQVRYYAALALTGYRYQPHLADAMLRLLADADPRVRMMAASWLSYAGPDAVPVYTPLLKHPDPNVRCCAVQILARLSPASLCGDDFLDLLRNPRPEAIRIALQLSGQTPWREGHLHFLQELTSRDWARLITNRLSVVRLIALERLRDGNDATAAGFAIPLLRDNNSLLRKRAVSLLRAATGQDIPETEPEKWEHWWAANKRGPR